MLGMLGAQTVEKIKKSFKKNENSLRILLRKVYNNSEGIKKEVNNDPNMD